MINQDLTRIVI